MAEVVLDSSAVLAVLQDEPGADVVVAAMDGALVSAVNLAEVVGKLIERGATIDEARLALRAIDLPVADYDSILAERTGELITLTRSQGLSLGDRACLALAAREDVPALTADRAWAGLSVGVEIRFIR